MSKRDKNLRQSKNRVRRVAPTVTSSMTGGEVTKPKPCAELQEAANLAHREAKSRPVRFWHKNELFEIDYDRRPCMICHVGFRNGGISEITPFAFS